MLLRYVYVHFFYGDNRTIERMQMSLIAACDWSVAGKSDARFDLDIDLLT